MTLQSSTKEGRKEGGKGREGEEGRGRTAPPKRAGCDNRLQFAIDGVDAFLHLLVSVLTYSYGTAMGDGMRWDGNYNMPCRSDSVSHEGSKKTSFRVELLAAAQEPAEFGPQSPQYKNE